MASKVCCSNQAANAAARTKGSIFEIVYRRSVPRLGHNQAIWAIAHRQCGDVPAIAANYSATNAMNAAAVGAIDAKRKPSDAHQIDTAPAVRLLCTGQPWQILPSARER